MKLCHLPEQTTYNTQCPTLQCAKLVSSAHDTSFDHNSNCVAAYKITQPCRFFSFTLTFYFFHPSFLPLGAFLIFLLCRHYMKYKFSFTISASAVASVDYMILLSISYILLCLVLLLCFLLFIIYFTYRHHKKITHIRLLRMR